MKKTLFTAIVVLLSMQTGRADEGMWLPALIGQRIGIMQERGLKLSAEDIYSINQASLKDAVVLFGGGCTGEIVSADGLLFTNHHCGYSYIQRHSSVEHDYLKDGFWAMSREEELPNPGLRVSFLERMEDVTEKVLAGYKTSMTEQQRDSLVRANSDALRKEAVKDVKGLRASVEALYYGNQYFLFLFKEYTDVRLVGCPPSSIGKFGGETDNWMWPRHTGDFSIFRIYADKDGNPADYSKDNVPFHPKRFFTISRKGVEEGDFTFIYGCPGRTTEYLMSEGVRYTDQIGDPLKIELRTRRLAVMDKYMSGSQAIRIQYSAKKSNVANAWKKWQGEVGGLRRNKIVQRKLAFERQFKAWAMDKEYKGLVEKIASVYAELEPYAYMRDLYTESVGTFELGAFASAASRSRKEGDNRLDAMANAFYKDYYAQIDKEILSEMINVFDKKALEAYKPEWFNKEFGRYGSAKAWADAIFDSTVFTLREKFLSCEDYEKDPAVQFYRNFSEWQVKKILPKFRELSAQLTLLYRDYMRGQMEFQSNRDFYPDANLTLRVAYGNVAGYSPRDGVRYKHVSTLKGIMEKDNPDIFDYNIPQALRDIYAQGGMEDQPVCFIATNHTTGGNSGSPVINGDGQLVGINFDRVWEGTMSDIAFDPAFCRNIALDVRYLLFIVDRIGNASYLFKEMQFAD